MARTDPFPTLRVLDVEPAQVSERAGNGAWPCSACEEPHPVGDGSIVRTFGPFGRADHIVCPGCAAQARARVRPRTAVLIVEDDTEYRDELRHWLEDKGPFRVCGEAAGISDAERMIDECDPELVILDLRLPDGDGLELLHRMRSLGHELPVVVLTAYPSDDAERVSVLLGSRGFLRKSDYRAITLAARLAEL